MTSVVVKNTLYEHICSIAAYLQELRIRIILTKLPVYSCEKIPPFFFCGLHTSRALCAD